MKISRLSGIDLKDVGGLANGPGKKTIQDKLFFESDEIPKEDVPLT